MLHKLLRIEWLHFSRSGTFAQSMAIKIFLGIIGLYFILTALGIGILADSILREQYPEDNVIDKFNGFFMYYLALDLIVRFMIQKFPSIAIQKFITLNIKKATLIKHLMIKSVFNFYNYLPLFIIIPFMLISVTEALNLLSAALWLSLVLIMVLLNHFISYWLHISSVKIPVLSYSIIAIILLLIYLEYRAYISIVDYLSLIINTLQSLPYIILPAAILIYISRTVYTLLKSNAFIESSVAELNMTPKVRTLHIKYLDAYGELGMWLNLELNLIWRNKKGKLYLFMSLAFILYPLTFDSSMMDSPYMLLMISMICVGSFTLNYGQFLFSWNSPHFDFILTQRTSIETYLRAKYILLVLSCISFFLISLPYGFIYPEMIKFNVVMLLFNAGFNAYLYMWFGLYYSRKMSITSGVILNYEGITAQHFLIMIPIIAIPLIIYFLGTLTGFNALGIYLLSAIGAAGILLSKSIMKKTANKMSQQKYKLHENFTKA